MARRSQTKATWPGKLDHIVAGGQPAGMTCSANVVKACPSRSPLAVAAIAADTLGELSVRCRPPVLTALAYGHLDGHAAHGARRCSGPRSRRQECGEEAGIPPELAATAVAAGAVSYTALQPAGVKRDVLFVYDLRLPAEFTPTPQVLLPASCCTYSICLEQTTIAGLCPVHCAHSQSQCMP